MDMMSNEKTAPGLRSGRELERELVEMHSSSADPVQMRQFGLHGLQMFSAAESCFWVKFVSERKVPSGQSEKHACWVGSNTRAFSD